jgi:hypothetical protein
MIKRGVIIHTTIEMECNSENVVYNLRYFDKVNSTGRQPKLQTEHNFIKPAREDKL